MNTRVKMYVPRASSVTAHARLPVSSISSTAKLLSSSAVSMASGTKRCVSVILEYLVTLSAAALFAASPANMDALRIRDPRKVSTMVARHFPPLP